MPGGVWGGQSPPHQVSHIMGTLGALGPKGPKRASYKGLMEPYGAKVWKKLKKSQEPYGALWSPYELP